MIGSLVKFLYADDKDNICVILRTYDTEEMRDYVSGDDLDEKELYLVYDLKTSEAYYALGNELDFICI